MIEKIQEYIFEQVERPALASQTLEDKYKQKIKATMSLIRQFRKPGDLLLYMDRFSGNDQKNEIYDRLKALGLSTFEDVVPHLDHLFGDQRIDCTNLDDFVVGLEYTSYDIAIFAKQYNVQPGIYRIHHENTLRAVFVKATFDSKGKYANEWLDNSTQEKTRLKYYLYSLKGKFDRNYKVNQAIINSTETPIYVFEKIKTVCYLRGIFNFQELHEEEDGALWCELIRQDFLQHLRPTTTSMYEKELDSNFSQVLLDSSTERINRLNLASRSPRKLQTLSTSFERNPDVIAEVLARAGETCERCGQKAPFIRRKDNTPYLEVHHIEMLANGGEDAVDNAVALCPNCHRFLHFGYVEQEDIEQLRLLIQGSSN